MSAAVLFVSTFWAGVWRRLGETPEQPASGLGFSALGSSSLGG